MTDLPLFPLGTVLFPDGLLPLRLFEQRYLEMAKACLRDASRFGACRQLLELDGLARLEALERLIAPQA